MMFSIKLFKNNKWHATSQIKHTTLGTLQNYLRLPMLITLALAAHYMAASSVIDLVTALTLGASTERSPIVVLSWCLFSIASSFK